MQKFTSFLELYAASVLRFGMAAVVLWFGLAQLLHTSQWTAYIYRTNIVAMSHLSATTIVYINSIFELVFGLLLVFGWKTRIVALLLALHLFDIMYVVGYGEIGVRDFGLAVGTLVVFMNGADALSIERKDKTIETTPEQVNQFIPQPKRLI